MVQAGGDRKQQDERRRSTGHRLELLNFGLIVYLCSGAFLFDHLSDSFGSSPAPVCSNRQRGGPVAAASRHELRNSSAKRMWDITNKLNILYEANWTAQVLDELAEFERRLEELESVSRDEPPAHQDAGGKPADSARVQASARKRSQRHLKKALIHSLAILTGVGSTRPLGEPQSALAKLITLLYAALGIPLLVATIACSGARLADRSLNLFLRVRHYCYSLPIHYLCHTCGLRWLCYCCWCCCCYSKCRLCCGRNTNTSCTSSCCDTSASGKQRPRLRLSNKQARQQRASAKVRFVEPQEYSEKSSETQQQHASLYSAGLFLTCLAFLLAYLALGARVYSKLEDKSLLDGLMTSFQLVSVTRFPDSFTSSPTQQNSTRADAKPDPAGNRDDEAQWPLHVFLWHFLYLFAGLNLISICVHIGWLCFSYTKQPSNHTQQPSQQPKTNGYIPEPHNGIPSIQELQDKLNESDTLASLTAASPFVLNPNSNQLAIQRQPKQHQPQVDLTELFVAVDQSPTELHLGYGQPIQGHQQLSDLSFASTDRSTEHGSLCLHHQAQYSHQQNSSSPANSFNTLYAPAKVAVYSSRQQVASAKLKHVSPGSYLVPGDEQQARVSIAATNQEFGELDEETRFGAAPSWNTRTMPTSYSSNHLSNGLDSQPILLNPGDGTAVGSAAGVPRAHSGASTLTRR